ncbi:MAG: GUN4 domain-containing protein, partial [Microcystis aeruginosa]
MFGNIQVEERQRREKERLETEARAKAEAERKRREAQEERQRLERERLAAEARAKAEAERKRREEEEERKRTATPALKSVRGVDYTKLRDLLAAGKWKEADQETANVMLEAAGEEEMLFGPPIDEFPCEDLRTINQLWLHYSKGKFGFSVQKEIYESLGGTREYNEEVWRNFGDRVGWRKGGEWLVEETYPDNRWWKLDKGIRVYVWRDSRLTFNINAPQGHLPMPRLFNYYYFYY